MNWFVVGIDTEVGKTVVSAILAEALAADYWKPISCGGSDADTVRPLISAHCHPESYCLKAPLSPHHAARLEGVQLTPPCLPQSERLVIEGTGGVMSPFSDTLTMLDLFLNWPGKWIVVSKNYLGSINHTLLTIDSMRNAGIEPSGIIFNGPKTAETESFILRQTGIRLIGHLSPEPAVDTAMIRRYAKQWKHAL